MADKKKKSKKSSEVKTPDTKKTSDNRFTGEIISICIGVFGIFIMLSLWFEAGGMAGNWFNFILKGLFGNGAYLLPAALIGAAICHFFVKDDTKSVYISSLFLSLCIFTHFAYITDSADYISGGIPSLWTMGTASTGGGVIGGVLAEILVNFLGAPTTAILIIAIALISIILLFRISVFALVAKFFKFLWKTIRESFSSLKNMADSSEEDDRIFITIPEEEEEEISISNPLDDGFPGHVELNPPKEIPQELPEEIPEISKQLTLTEEEPEEETNDDGDITEELEENIAQPVREYVFPTSDLLDKPAAAAKTDKVEHLRESAARLLEILSSFGIDARVTNVTRGSSVTRYEVVPAAGVKVSKITALDQDIAMRLPAQNVRIEILPGSVGIEASNDKTSAVYIRDMIESSEFINHPSKVAAVLGRDIDGKVVVVDISKMPHLLIAGATGSGKSVCINTIITSILFKSSPEDVRLVMVDPKVVELEMYNGIPHLLVPIVTDPRKAAGALCWAVNEMEERYKKFAELSVRNISGYNEKVALSGGEKMPTIVIIIDELADLMMVAPGEVQDYICRLAQKARAAGMHLILATQRPSVDVITGLIKANIPSRFSFQVSSSIDSRTILDCGGAEKLMGKGDMLMMVSGSNKLVRVQGAYVSDRDVERITGFIKQNSDANYSSDIQKSIEQGSAGANNKNVVDDEDKTDELFEEAVEIAFELDQISTSMLQRRLKIGYARAGRLIDLMDKMGIISTYDGSNKPRTLRMTRDQYYAMMAAANEEDAPESPDEPF